MPDEYGLQPDLYIENKIGYDSTESGSVLVGGPLSHSDIYIVMFALFVD